MENGFAWLGTLFCSEMWRWTYRQELVERSGERPLLVYSEDMTFQRIGQVELRAEKWSLKLFYTMRMKRILMVLCSHNQLYKSLCPYNTPKNAVLLEASPKTKAWSLVFCKARNTPEGTVARFRREADISGFKTNRSLRATTAIHDSTSRCRWTAGYWANRTSQLRGSA